MGGDETGAPAAAGDSQRSGGAARGAAPDEASGAGKPAADEPPDTQSTRTGGRGFFSRIFGALSPPEDGADSPPAMGTVGSVGVVPQLPGMANLRRLRIEDVMLPKAEVVSVPVEIGKVELVKVFKESGLTRLPVYRGTLDSPVGLIHLKDFALKYGFNGKAGRFALEPMLRPLLFVPPSMPLGVLLQKMQAERMHMALVIDEYGGVDGLVTIEDIIEQVVGEIEDEHDIAEAASFVLESPGVWLAKATTPLDEFEAAAGVKLVAEDDEDEIDTLGGLVFMLAGHVPVRGEVVLHPVGHEFVVVEADPRRIKRLRVRLRAPEAEAG